MAKSSKRDDFTTKTRLQIAKRSGWLCSDPQCRRPTVGATSDGNGEIMLGEASHICAAAQGGPRYDASMTKDERRSANNGIWLCNLHAEAVDAGDPKYTTEILRNWKRQAEEHSHRRVLYNASDPTISFATGNLATRLHLSATADVHVLRRSERWPSTDVALTVRVGELDEPVQTSALSRALRELGDLVLVAPPGMGKTSTLLQVAEGLLGQGETPIFVALADWGTENKTLLDSILCRAAFNGKVTESDFRAVAQEPGVYLLLDGWNELDSEARRRATAELKRLQAELPQLGLFISTRKQSLDVPFEGIRVELQPLSEAEQMQVARALRGDGGAQILYQAWRTSGVRELVSIPLYLTAILSLPENQPFPRTKGEVLLHFIRSHEQQSQHAELLYMATKGLHNQFLSALAVTATKAMNTSISEVNARQSVSLTDDRLFNSGQIAIKLQTIDVLDALVSHHLLVRAAGARGYSFQHQQFQEWYASSEVERLMLEGVDNSGALQTLRTEIFNTYAWEEAILFAVERLARGEERQRIACAIAIVAAFTVDPMLAADMIFHATDEVWAQVSDTIKSLLLRWHSPGKVDRAARFMITAGRPEFRDIVWSLIANENDQISLTALRVGRRFRPSVLGPNCMTDIMALNKKTRQTVVSEIALAGGMDGLDLATTIAKESRDSDLKIAVVQALTFRHADRHVVEILGAADEDDFDLILRRTQLREIGDAQMKERIARAHARQGPITNIERLQNIVYAHGGSHQSAQLAEVIATIEIDRRRTAEVALIREAWELDQDAVSHGLLRRLREGRELFSGADRMLAASRIVIEDETLLQIVLNSEGRIDGRANAAASILGPICVGKLIDRYLNISKEIRELGRYEKSLSDEYFGLRDRISHSPGASLATAAQERARGASNDEIRELAGLLCRRDGESAIGRPFTREARAAISQLAQHWGERLIASGASSTRSQLAAVANLIGHIPSVVLLPMLGKLLDDEIRRYREFHKLALREGKHGAAINEARILYTNIYQQAFAAIRAPETTELMISYLPNEHFGEAAATVLKVQWLYVNEPKSERLWVGVDFSHVEEKRAMRARRATLTSHESEAMFEVISPLVSDVATDSQKKRAIALAIHALRLPHGARIDTVRKLLSIANQRTRAELLLSLVLSGEIVPFKIVQAGIDDLFEEAKQQPWVLDENWQLKSWVILLPFTDNPVQLVDAIAALPAPYREPHFLEEMIRACEFVKAQEIEEALFKLAESDVAFYRNQDWRDAVRRRGTLTSARRYLDAAMSGKINDSDAWRVADEIAELISQHSELRNHVYSLLKSDDLPGVLLLANAVAQDGDHDGMLLLVDLENRLRRSVITLRDIQNAVTRNVPSEQWIGTFEVMPADASKLRRNLLEMTTDGGPNDAAARALRAVEWVRDEYGSPDNEPRHPNIASKKPWPILVSGPEVIDSE